MNNAPYLAHTDPLFHSNRILKIHDIYKLNVGLYMYDRQHLGQFIRNHDHNTRNRDDLLPNQVRMTVCEQSLSVAGPNIWNSISAEIRDAPSRNSFKTRYKRHLISGYMEPDRLQF